MQQGDGRAAENGVGTPQNFAGSIYDSTLFQPLPCSFLTWTSQQGGTTSLPANSCNPQVKFNSVGSKTIMLTGKDSQNASDSASVVINISNPPSSGPPIVSWLFPINQTLLAPDQGVQLKGIATDPDGKSPINYEWRLMGNLKGGVNNKIIGTTATGNGNVTGITFKPVDYVRFDCGGAPVSLMCRYYRPYGTV